MKNTKPLTKRNNILFELPTFVRCLVWVCVIGFVLPSTVSAFSPIQTTALLTPAVSAPKDDVPELPVDTLPEKISTTKIPVGFKSFPASPKNNPMSEAKASLGRRLFFDPILSNDGTVSCASCHKPEHGFASPDPISIGIAGKKGTRNAPTVLNRGYGTAFSWDGRDDSLEKQIMGPLTSETELGGNLKLIIANLKKDKKYVSDFGKVFASSKNGSDGKINTENVAKAIACFERTLNSGNSPVDRFRNEEYEALSKEARQGLWIFESRGGCWKCHNGAALADDKFHNTGVGFGQKDRDVGRSKITENEEHKFQFKTPGLRDIEFSAPYMHDGSVKTLKEVVEFYNKGGAPDDPTLDKKMKPLKLSEEEVGFLVEFLKALSGDGLK